MNPLGGVHALLVIATHVNTLIMSFLVIITSTTFRNAQRIRNQKVDIHCNIELVSVTSTLVIIVLLEYH